MKVELRPARYSTNGSSAAPHASVRLSAPIFSFLSSIFSLVARKEEADIKSILKIIQSDEKASPHLLRIINSAYYGIRTPVDNVERGIILLGPNTFSNVLVAYYFVRLKTYFGGSVRQCFLKLLTHSLATAFYARHLAGIVEPRNPARDPGEWQGLAFTCGLLHDMGKLVFLIEQGETSADVYQQEVYSGAAAGFEPHEVERRIFGIDHRRKGAIFAAFFEVPDIIRDINLLHHTPQNFDGAHDDRKMIEIVCAANLAANSQKLDFDDSISWPQCADHPVWSHLVSSPSSSADDEDALLEDLSIHRKEVVSAVRHFMDPFDG